MFSGRFTLVFASFCLLYTSTVASLIRYRLQHERTIQRVAEAMLPTRYGDFRMIAYESEMDGMESHLALVYGDQIACDGSGQSVTQPVLVRVHTHCLAGDVFGATLCDCHELLDNSLRMIAEAGHGALIYLHNAGRGFSIDRSSTASSGEMAPSRLVPVSYTHLFFHIWRSCAGRARALRHALLRGRPHLTAMLPWQTMERIFSALVCAM